MEEGNIYGYARVSSKEQNLDRQLVALSNYVTERNIVVDKCSGKNLERPGYMALKSSLGLRKGDTLYIKSLDRLSRNKLEMKQELEWFRQAGIRLVVLDLPTTMVQISEGQEWILDMINNILIEVLSSIAEQERVTIRNRQKEGIEAAKLQGKHLGRPKLMKPDNFDSVVERWKNNEITARQAQKELGMSASSFYRVVKLCNSL